MKKNFFRDMVESSKLKDASILADGKNSAEFTGYINTGCYALNALTSGTIFGGIPNNSCTALAGDPATGKTFFLLSVLANFLADDETAGAMLNDTESAIRGKMALDRGIDADRIVVNEPQSIQGFRTDVLNILDKYAETPKDERPPFMIALDSLGMLSTQKELEDTASGSDTKDMTKTQQVKATFRVLRLKLAKLQVPMMITNHVYAGIGQYAPARVISGGSGLIYAADTILMLSKAKDKDGKDVVGNLIKVKTFKSRLSRENQEVTLKLSYDRGLDRHFGLLDIAEKGGVIKKNGVKYDLPGGGKAYGKEINENPEQVFTKDVLLAIDEAAGKMFSYGSPADEPAESIEEAIGE